MKTILLIAVVGMLAVGVSAGGLGDAIEDVFEGLLGGWWTGCKCRNQCARNNGTKNLPCYHNRGEYLQCVDKTCSNHTCPDNQLFNFTSRQCDPCPPGFHVDASKRRCVCNNGTRLDFVKRQCVDCPTGATILADRCFCNNSIYDKENNTCKACPANSTQLGNDCVCDDKLFWNKAAFQCQGCPGKWVNYTIGFFFFKEVIQRCQCQGDNQFFNLDTVTCVTCPPNSIASRYGENSCDCNKVGYVYNQQNNTCVAVTKSGGRWW